LPSILSRFFGPARYRSSLTDRVAKVDLTEPHEELPRLSGRSHAMDLILTGRGVQGEEALRMGLVNRLVARGQALDVSLHLTHDLADFPQRCLRSDRLSAYEQWSLPYEEALRNELRRGVEVVESGETVTGATSFARGQGRHGAF
jgi:enoyl-CoA hydratase/carnithine racemase